MYLSNRYGQKVEGSSSMHIPTYPTYCELSQWTSFGLADALGQLSVLGQARMETSIRTELSKTLRIQLLVMLRPDSTKLLGTLAPHDC